MGIKEEFPTVQVGAHTRHPRLRCREAGTNFVARNYPKLAIASAGQRATEMMQSAIKVLVVEDEPLVLMDIADQLTDRGFAIIEASNADEAIIQLSIHLDIAIVFTDIDMPGSMDGLKLAAAVRDGWPPIKIIVTSGHRPVLNDDLPIGSRFFGKPFRADAIATVMLAMVGR